MIVACLACELLFEVDVQGAYTCPQCARALVVHDGQFTKDSTDAFNDQSVDRTQLLDVPLDDHKNVLDEFAHFGSSPSVSIDSTRMLSPIQHGPPGGLDHTQVLDVVDESSDKGLPPTVFPKASGRMHIRRPKDESNDVYEEDLWTSAVSLEPDRARGRRNRSSEFITQDHTEVPITKEHHRHSGRPRSQAAEEMPPTSLRRIDLGINVAPPPFKKNRGASRAKKPSVVPDSVDAQSTVAPGVVQARRSLDNASPQPIDSPLQKTLENTNVQPKKDARQPKSAPKAQRTILEAPPFDGPDAIDALIDGHRESLNSQVDLEGTKVDISVPSLGSRLRPLAITVFVFSCLVVTALWLSDKSKPKDKETATNRQKPTISALKKALQDLKIVPIPVKGVDSANDVSFIALGNDGAQSSIGPIAGLTSLTIPAARVSQDSGGSWLEAVRGALFSSRIKRDRMAIALDRNGKARQLWLVAQSIQRAGFRQALLVVERTEDGQLGVVPFYAGKKSTPSAGEVVVRVSQDGLYVSVVARDGSLLAPDMQPIKRHANGELDLNAIDQRLDALSRRFPLIRATTAYVEPNLNIQALVGLMHRLRYGEKKERFTSIRLVAQ